MASSRLLKELKTIRSGSEEDVVLSPKSDNNLYTWVGYIVGPPDTPFQDGVFELEINIPDNYPLQPPKIIFVTKIFHPNIHFKTGEICLDILKDAWSAAYTLQATCRSIIALLSHPEADSPLNCDCGNLIRSGDNRGYFSLAKMYTKLFASNNIPLEYSY
eukprot:TRINITY_DN1848_c0_g1_i1.p1 TRINITY_DN1848_c0_g1~~TRINITY_DN1848_c0_g1_i1.p1  ORF type:complete len:160 (+),score=40.15 TRINITY_DN1848_c0_g1_i1:67-546(+)